MYTFAGKKVRSSSAYKMLLEASMIIKDLFLIKSSTSKWLICLLTIQWQAAKKQEPIEMFIHFPLLVYQKKIRQNYSKLLWKCICSCHHFHMLHTPLACLVILSRYSYSKHIATWEWCYFLYLCDLLLLGTVSEIQICVIQPEIGIGTQDDTEIHTEMLSQLCTDTADTTVIFLLLTSVSYCKGLVFTVGYSANEACFSLFHLVSDHRPWSLWNSYGIIFNHKKWVE